MAKKTERQQVSEDAKKSEAEYMKEFLSGTEFDPGEEQEEDLSQYQEQAATTFPPYWNPGLGKGFVGRVVDLDARDPEFLRYVVETASAINCGIGPVETGEAVTVQPGELFTLSVYKSLPLHEYMGLKDPIVVVCVGSQPVKGRPNEMWRFRIRTSSRDALTMTERRKAMRSPELSARLKEAFQIAHSAKDSKTAVKAFLNQ